MNRMQAALASAFALLVASGLSTADAQSNYVYLDQQSSGAGVCAAALPAFEGLVRKRPRAIQNEGSTNAFVTCAPPQFTEAADPGLGPSIVLVNHGAGAVTVLASAPIVCRTDGRQSAAQFEVGQLVSFDVEPGATFTPAL